MAAMRLRYDIVDVFTDRPFAGNQLAVVHGADDLTTEQCHAIAREFNFSETTFPATRVNEHREYATRIFTPGGEIPFAGHPTLGTAWVLRAAGLIDGTDAVQICGAGRIGVRFDDPVVELTATPRDLVGPLPDDLVADLLGDLGLSAEAAAGPGYVAGCGLGFIHLPVTESAVVRAVPSSTSLAAYVDRLAALGHTVDPVDGINVVHLSGSAPHLYVHARVFVPGLDVAEDPATGSAAAGLGMALVASGVLPHGGRYSISQGLEMGRPSALEGQVEAAEGRATVCRVAGQVHPVASGEIEVP
jgi:trans-2,3-dihydro-3-hydroxyanthranilate isomerase